jgi:hypothetical protein
MEEAFAIVLFVVVGVAFVAAVWALATSGGSYEQIGQGGIESAPQRPATDAERDAEIREMLALNNAHRAARGEPPLVLGEPDPELREEVRALVEAKNARRAARGQEPLDVEAEVERRLREL